MGKNEETEIILGNHEKVPASFFIKRKRLNDSKTHEEFFALEIGVKANEVDEIIQDNKVRGNKARIVVPTDEIYINWSIRFVSEKPKIDFLNINEQYTSIAKNKMSA